MKRVLTILAICALCIVAGCTSSSDIPQVSPNDVEVPDLTEENGPDPAAIISGIGTVKYLDFEGGFYGIETDDGKRFNPQNLDAEYRQDGLRVRFRAEKQDLMTTQMWGTSVKIIDMLPLDD